MELVHRIAYHATHQPDAVALVTSQGETASYGELWERSSRIAALIDSRLGVSSRGIPVMVYGHKSLLMLASMLACMRTGHPYVPADCFSVPVARVAQIYGQLGEPLILACEDLELPNASSTLVNSSLLSAAPAAPAPDVSRCVHGEELVYILFTSGSTGTPKGVQVSAACLDNFTAWSVTLGNTSKAGRVYLDQAPFSFDLSVFELAGALSSGGSLFCLTHQTQSSMAAQLEALAHSGVQVWVSTPSFAEMCLADPSFNQTMLPNLEVFLFCGETLPVSVARRLAERFSKAVIVNTYGPTESTVAVSEVVLTPEMLQTQAALPVGKARPGTTLHIVDASGQPCPAGEWGEIVIEGDTVALGYYGRPDLTEAAFGTVSRESGLVRTYRTGDEGRLDNDGMLYYRGRLDLQVKLNGYRIELGEIEQRLRWLDGIDGACVVAARREGRISHLVGYVVSTTPRPDGDFRAGLTLKKQLSEVLPHYMVPKKIVFIDSLPQTANGKLDRRALEAACER